MSCVHFEKKIFLYSTYSSFLVIKVCNQGKTLCSPYIYIYDDEHSLKLNVVVGVKTIKSRVLMPENRGIVQTRRFLNMPT